MPPVPPRSVSSESVYGTCLDIYNRTDDSYSIVEEYPDPRTLDWNQWQGWASNDDFVVSDPNVPAGVRHRYGTTPLRSWYDPRRVSDQAWFLPLVCGMVVLGALQKLRKRRERRELGYTELKV